MSASFDEIVAGLEEELDDGSRRLRGIVSISNQRQVVFTVTTMYDADTYATSMGRILEDLPFISLQDVDGKIHLIRCTAVDHIELEELEE